MFEISIAIEIYGSEFALELSRLGLTRIVSNYNHWFSNAVSASVNALIIRILSLILD